MSSPQPTAGNIKSAWISASKINSHLRGFLHDTIARPKEDVDGTLVVGTIIGSSHSKICELNIISSCHSLHYGDLVGLVRLFTSIEIRPSGRESLVLSVIYPT